MVRTPLSNENILWLADIKKDQQLIKKLFRNNDINQSYDELLGVLKILRSQTIVCNPEDDRSRLLEKVSKLKNKIESDSVLSQFIDRPFMLFFNLKIKRICEIVCKQ